MNLNDHENATFLDLGTQFYLSASDVGKSRVEVTTPVRRLCTQDSPHTDNVQKIAELNPYVRVTSSHVDLAKGDLSALDNYKVRIAFNKLRLEDRSCSSADSRSS